MITPGLVSITFRQFSPEKIVELVAQANLQSIEWGGDIHVPHGNIHRAQEVLTLTKNAGLQIAAYGSYYRAGESEPQLSFDAVLETALALQAPTIRVWCGKLPSHQADENYRIKVAEDLRRISEKAATHNITISCEYHNNTLTDTLESALDTFRHVNHHNLKTYWQPRHGEPIETGLHEIDQLERFLTNIHVFHWQYNTAHELLRLPLSDGLDRWITYLNHAQKIPNNRHALLEFTCTNEPEQFLRDAQLLKKMLV